MTKSPKIQQLGGVKIIALINQCQTAMGPSHYESKTKIILPFSNLQ